MDSEMPFTSQLSFEMNRLWSCLEMTSWISGRVVLAHLIKQLMNWLLSKLMPTIAVMPVPHGSFFIRCYRSSRGRKWLSPFMLKPSLKSQSTKTHQVIPVPSHHKFHLLHLSILGPEIKNLVQEMKSNCRCYLIPSTKPNRVFACSLKIARWAWCQRNNLVKNSLNPLGALKHPQVKDHLKTTNWSWKSELSKENKSLKLGWVYLVFVYNL